MNQAAFYAAPNNAASATQQALSVTPKDFAAALRARADACEREEEAQALERAFREHQGVVYERRIQALQDAADAAVEGVLSAHLSPRALAALEQFRHDLDQESEFVGLSLADCLECLFDVADDDARKALKKTMQRIQRQA